MISLSDFRKICKDGDMDVFNATIPNIKSGSRYIIDNGFDFDYRNAGLVGACEGGHLNIINLMIGLGANNWNHGLTGACKGGHLNIVKLMIGKGADDFTQGLRRACEGGHLDIVKLMIQKGADNWDVGLHGACRGGHLNIVGLMIERGADDFTQGLRYACMGGHLNIIEFLIGHGTDNWNYGLYGACEGRQLHIVKLMIEKGADEFDLIFDLVPEMIDPDIVGLISKKGTSFKPYLEYPEDKIKIFELYSYGLPLNSLRDIDGFDILEKEIEYRRNTIRPVIFDNLIKDLVEIVTEYIID